MFATTCSLTLIINLLTLANTAPQSFPFVESFDQTASQRWQPFAGTWTFEPGAARQTDSGYDCGAAIDVTPEGPFYLAIRFKPDSNFNGAGLFFALPTLDKKHGGMMVRCDPGGRILWGWFDNNGVFNYHGDVMYDDDGDTEQELAIVVDPDKLAFNILHHGQRITTNIRTFHANGRVGMQTSGGPHTITRFEVRPATEDELAGIKPPGAYSRMISVIGSRDFLVALRRAPEFLTVYNADGERAHGVDAASLPGVKGDDAHVTAMCWAVPNVWEMDSDKTLPPDVLVLADDGRAIYKIKRAKKPLADGPLVRSSEMRGMGIAVGPGGHIFVADEAIPGIRVFDPDGQELLKYGEQGGGFGYDHPSPTAAGKFKQPRGIAVSPAGEIVVMDRGNYGYAVYRYNAAANKLEWVSNSTWLPMVEGAQFDAHGRLLLSGTFEFYRSHGALRVMSLSSHGQRVFVGASLGDMSDKVRACEGPNGKYYLADPDKDRILILPRDFVEPLPEFEWTSDGRVKLVMTKVDGSTVTTTSKRRSPDHPDRILVKQAEPICESWPPIDDTELTTYELPPKPPKGQMYVIDMPVLVTLFAKAVDEKGNELHADPTGVVDRLKREHARDRHFYWLNSHCILNKQFEYMVIDDVVAKVNGGWIQPGQARRLVNAAREKRGLPPISVHHSLIGIHPMAGFDPNTTDDPGYVGGGGLTPYAYSGYALWNNGQAWLMGHEWGHQLDAYFEKSGFTDWWLNHPDGTVHIGRYGEHWDCNAFLCRRVDPMNWLRFKPGTLRLVADRDQDGLPDDDPTLPLDERRFGSDPSKPDTDGDGLSDLREATAGTFTSANPTRVDTDADTIPDAEDPYPQFAVYPALKPVKTVRDGLASPAEHGFIGRISRDWCATAILGAYDADNIYLLIGLLHPARQVFATVDFNDDGWFVGQDNVYAHVDLGWPNDGGPRINRAERCEARFVRPIGVPPDVLPGCPALALKIPRPQSRTPLQPGSSIGLTVRFQNGGGSVAFLIDPWQILSLDLK